MVTRQELYDTLLFYLRNNKPTILAVLFIGVFVDVLLVAGNSDLRILAVLIVYILSIRFYQLNSRITFLFCLSLLVIMFISFLFSDTSLITEKTAVWIVLFAVIGVVQQWKELDK